MKTEISAGGIIIRKNGSAWEILVVRDKNEEFTFPKGKIEEGETEEIAARREIAEEVGITHITMLCKLPVVRYMYSRRGLISKTVHYFLFQNTGKEKVVPQKEEGLHDAQWLPLDEAIEKIGYKKTNKPLLLEVKEFLLSFPT
jgi:8-oxo-dGTP pyrophosphatase MutT (NUDIX family)